MRRIGTTFRLILHLSLCASSLALAGTSSAKDPSWLVTIRTTAPDGSITEGTGSILKKGNRYYVPNSSHVSQLGRVEILQSGSPLSVLGGRSDNFHDVEVFEVKGASGSFGDEDTLAIYDARTRRFWVQNPLKLDKTQAIAAGEDAFVPVRSVLKNSLKGWKPYEERPSGLGTGNGVSAWQVQSTLGGNELTSRMRFSPGVSGSPLVGKPSDASTLAFEKDGKVLFAEQAWLGTASRYLCDFDRSYFSDAEITTRLIEEYEAGAPKTETVIWKKKNGVFARDLGEGTLEADLSSPKAGGGGSTDGGGGGSTDGGGGGSTDGGDSALRNPCGNPLTHQGMIWKGKPVVAFRLIPKNVAPDNRAVVIHANLAAVDFIRKNGAHYRVEPIDEGAPLLPLLKEKLKTTSDHFFIEPAFGPSRAVVCGGKFASTATDLLEVRDGHLRASLTGCAGEQLYFELDQNGAQIGSGNPKFQPIIRVRARSSGQTYTIDLRNLFATDLSTNYQSASAQTADSKKRLNEAYDAVFLGIRDRESGRDQVLDLKKGSSETVVKLWPNGRGSLQFMEIQEIRRPCP